MHKACFVCPQNVTEEELIHKIATAEDDRLKADVWSENCDMGWTDRQ
jgi:hypothetical protein